MERLVLINMPLATLPVPSLGLTQLKAVVDEQHADRLRTEVLYLNHDFANEIGFDFYRLISSGLEHNDTGVRDWFFRPVAFPELEDNHEAYFRRYYPRRDKATMEFKKQTLEKRAEVEGIFEGLIDRYRLHEAKIVGFTSMFFQNVSCFGLARKIKEVNPEVVIVMGGANCEAPMGEALVQHVPVLDFTFQGPALVNFPQFVGHVLDGDMEACHRIDGVCSRQNQVRGGNNSSGNNSSGNNSSGSDGIHIGGSSDTERAEVGVIGKELDINTWVPLDYDPFLKNLRDQFPEQKIEPILQFETSRGCWWGERAHCTFCGLNGVTMAYRAMKPELALKLFDELFTKYGDICSRFECVDNILPREYLTEVLPHLEPPPNVAIFYEVKSDLTSEHLAVLSKAGVTLIQPGIEALATSNLKLMRKGATAFQNVKLLKNCLLHNVYPLWSILVGFPGETEAVYEGYQNDIPILAHLPPPSDVYTVKFERYAPYFNEAEEYGLDLHPYDHYGWTYPFSEDVLMNIAYFFDDRNNINADYFRLMIKWLEKTRRLVKKAWVDPWGYEDSQRRPRLFFKDQGRSNIVVDSRSGEIQEYRIDAVARRLLEFADERARKLQNFADEFKGVADFDAEKQVAMLVDKGLLFHHEGRYMNLVLPRESEMMAPIHS